MSTKKDIDNLLEQVNDFSKGRLKMKEDIGRLIDISLESKNGKILEETAFLAKYIQGLFNIIQRGESAVDDDVLNKYVKEYTENIEKIKSNLRIILNHSSSFYKTIFEEKYCSLSQNSITNLNELCYDLSWVKMYLNEKNIKL